MSLTIAFKVAQKGISQTEKQFSVLSSNINNANTVGYTRKIYQSNTITSDSVTSPTGGSVIQATVDTALTRQLNTQSTASSYDQTIATYLGNYSDSFGSTAGTSTTLSSTVDSLTSALQALEANPTQTSAKSSVVSAAQQVASQLNGISQTIQSERLQANNAIGASVDAINTSLQTIATLNRKITEAAATGDSAADLTDQRNMALQTLSQQIGSQYFTDDNGQLKVFTTAGDLLVSGDYTATLAYTPAGNVSSGTAYPGGFSPITLNGTDITTRLHTGTLGALITLRDTTLTGEQAKLDGFANVLANTVNTVTNQGASVPPRNNLTGTAVTTPATALSATGTWRVAVTNASGIVQSYADLNLSTYTTMGALVTALNGISGLSASINASGQLSLTASSGNGVSLNEMNSSIGGKGASSFFGLNNLFQGNNSTSVTASNIQLSSYLAADNTVLATGALSSGTIATGDHGVTSGDTATVTALVNLMNTAQAFTAAGTFASRSATLSGYANAILSSAATQASASQDVADTSQATFTYLNDKLTNKTGVNIDEESANMTMLQSNYEATAMLMSTIRDLFKTLIAVVAQ